MVDDMAPAECGQLRVRAHRLERVARPPPTSVRDAGILVRYFARRLLDDGLRITVGTDDEIDALLLALASFQPGN
jgi:histidinol-phosphate/aromatic aminotransferase/cobyric acid decarboxylase-like protein